MILSLKSFEHPVFEEILDRDLLLLHLLLLSLPKLLVKKTRLPLHQAQIKQQLQVKISKYSSEWHPNLHNLK